MDLQLAFTAGRISGSGWDDIGSFDIHGSYCEESMECHWTKRYHGLHSVKYRGFREGKGIWGTWEIGDFARGGFHIWPKQAGDSESVVESEIAAEPVDAIATQTSEVPLAPATDN